MRDFRQDHRWLSINTATVRKQRGQDWPLLDILVKLVDTAKDVGLAIGPEAPANVVALQLQEPGGALAWFRLASSEAARDEATARAFAVARERAAARAATAAPPPPCARPSPRCCPTDRWWRNTSFARRASTRRPP